MNVLFVCHDNCALSLMAEAILNSVGAERFQAFSAATGNPAPVVNPYAMDFLSMHYVSVGTLRSKPLSRFLRPDAPRMDFIITLCDVSAGESFAAWPGNPFIAHWNVESEDGLGDTEDALRDSFWTLMRRIKIFTSLPHGELNRRVLERRVLTLEASYL